MKIIESTGLGKRYGRTWALLDCTLSIPGGHIVALVGPNGAGKTTLLNLGVGLARPTSGTVRVLDGLAAGSPEALDQIAFVAQDAPLYRTMPVKDMLRVASYLNLRWDGSLAAERLARLRIGLSARVGTLSGGQKAQLALTIALARRPSLLVLDEPLAALDPVARDDFMQSMRDEVAGSGISVLFSSHVVAELSQVASYIVVLGQGSVLVAGDVPSLEQSHGAGLGKIVLQYMRSSAVAA
jgi:ABC-2 type transport system ATP-binding protein